MAYLKDRYRGRRALAGVSSVPPGRRVATMTVLPGLSGLHEYGVITSTTLPPPPPPRARTRAVGRLAHSGQPAWYRAMQGTTLGADDPEPSTSLAQPSLPVDPVDPGTREFRTKLLASHEQLIKIGERWVRREELQRWLQIAATLAIPLSAVIWRAIFRAGRVEQP